MLPRLSSLSRLGWPGAGRARLGLDITAQGACLVDLQGRASRLRRHGWMPLDAGLLEGGRILEFERLAQSLQSLMEECGVRARQVALALPAAVCRRAVLAVPASIGPRQWQAWLQEQARQVMAATMQKAEPTAPDDRIAWDYHWLPGSPVRVSLLAAPLETVEDWQGLAEACGLVLSLLDERRQALLAGLSRLGLAPGGQAPWLLADLDALELHCFAGEAAPQTWELSATPAGAAWPSDTARPWDGAPPQTDAALHALLAHYDLLDLPEPPSACWLVGGAGDHAGRVEALGRGTGWPWQALVLDRHLQLPPGQVVEGPASSLLAALGLARPGFMG